MPIYITKMPDGTVRASGDLRTAKDFGGYDMVISEDDWENKYRTSVHLDENKNIVLGPSTEQNAARVRFFRDRKLKLECDRITVLRWNVMSEEDREAWAAYRQALLDIPQTDGFPWDGDDVPWPTRPDEEG